MPDIIANIRDEFLRIRNQAEKALASLDDQAFFQRPSPECNPIALVVKHMGGNLKSRWNDFLATDGEKPNRNRDGEFLIDEADSRSALMAAWNDGWATLLNTLSSLSDADLDRAVTIRGEPHTVLQALLRNQAHAAYHNGQILYLARFLRPDRPWLTIAPGASAQFTPGESRRV